MSVEIIQRDGERYAVLPYEEYRELLENLEDARDVALVDSFYERLNRGEEELVPGVVVDQLLAGENPVRVWREYRSLTQQALADGAGISKNYLSQIETGQRDGRVRVLQALAQALGVDLDELVIEPEALND